MTMEAGMRLGPYEIVEPLGAGGMGEVYRARDTRLERSVAAKVLPQAASRDAGFRARFEREAKTISRLNHPHICQIYDVGETDGGVAFLIMELLDGETLADRLSRGPLPLADVLRYGKEIADALAAAHRAGIVHRDLKPGNIMLTRSGAKLLDFGLAKQAAGAVVLSDPNAPTVAHATSEKPLTREGTIVGTFQYMAPEQLEGLEADARTDIFAFGNVLYEMLTGRRAFDGKTRTSLIAAIVDREPAPISSLQPLTPPSLEHVVLKCLEKDPNARWQSARDVGSELEWIERSKSGETARTRAPLSLGRRAAVAVAVLALIAAAAAAAWSVARRRPAPPKIYASINAPSPAGFDFFAEGAGSLSLSPDGRMLTVAVPERGGRSRLWLRALATGAARPLPGTEGAIYPFWSPDSRKIGFFADGKLKTIALAGGPPVEVCPVQEARGGAWSADGTIVFAPHWRESLWKVAAGGGTPQRLTRLRADRQETTHRFPRFLPDGRHVIYLSGTHLSGPASANNALYVASLDGGEPRLLTRARSNAVYAAGNLLYLRDRFLVAQPFDPDEMAIEGEPVSIADGVRYELGFFRGVFDATADVLVFQRGVSLNSSVLQWYDRGGRKAGTIGEPAELYSLSIARDGTRVAVAEGDPSDVWIHDIRRRVKSRATFEPLNEDAIAWGPDGNTIYYNTDRNVYWDVYRKSTGGTAEELLAGRPDAHEVASDVSPDGKLLLYDLGGRGGTEVSDIHVLRLDGSKASMPYIATQFNERGGRFSPDGRWVAYASGESGRMEIYLSSFPDPSVKQQVSVSGGSGVRWRGDGRELFYRRPDGMIVAVEVTLQPAVSIGEPRPLFRST